MTEVTRGEHQSCIVFGVRCFVGDVASAADAVLRRAMSGRGGYGAFCNVHVLMTAQRESDVMSALEGAWNVFPDGAPVAWYERRLGRRDAARVGGPDLMSDVFARGQTSGLRHALLGSTPNVVSALRARIATRFPAAEVVAAHAPDRGEEDEYAVLATLVEARPHIVWCAFGAPKQELWMARNAMNLAPALVLGVGAAFDFHAGTKKRAPRWMQRLGLEWAHRMGSEPTRLTGRYLRSNTAFAVRAARELPATRRDQTSGAA